MSINNTSWMDILKRRKRRKNLTEDQKNMVEWNNEEWEDMGGEKKGRYAPKEVAESLTPSQRAYENRKKREGRKKGQQHVPRGKSAKKVYRRIEGR